MTMKLAAAVRMATAFLIFASTACRTAWADSACAYNIVPQKTAQPSAATPVKLSRGVNLSRWWEDDQDRALDADEIKNITDLGFDFVRLPISPKWLQAENTDKHTRQLGLLRCDIVSLLHAGLKVIVDLHPGSDFDTSLSVLKPQDAVIQLEALWHTLQPAIMDLPTDRILVSLYNEPHFKTAIWWKMQGQMLSDLRSLFPHTTIIVTPSPDSGAWNLKSVLPYHDKNVIYDIHFYEPLAFTHHGVEWAPDYTPRQAALPVPYPVDKDFTYETNDPDIRQYVSGQWDHAKIAHFVEEIAAWKKTNHVTLACLEFGVYRLHTDKQSRLNWLSDVRTELERNGLPWALWEYRGPFGLIPSRSGLDEDMASILGLGHTASP